MSLSCNPLLLAVLLGCRKEGHASRFLSQDFGLCLFGKALIAVIRNAVHSKDKFLQNLMLLNSIVYQVRPHSSEMKCHPPLDLCSA